MIKKNRKPNRLHFWDYRSNYAYFVTINTYGGQGWFGEVINGTMVLNNYGRIITRQWQWLGRQYADWLLLTAFVVMPNHVHGIVVINHGRRFVGTTPTAIVGKPRTDVGTAPIPIVGTTPIPIVGTAPIPIVGTALGLSLRNKQRNWPPQSLSQAMCAFKTTSSKLIHRSGGNDFRWQRSFYDRIIRDQREYYVVCRYIKNNPRRWHDNRNGNLSKQQPLRAQEKN